MCQVLLILSVSSLSMAPPVEPAALWLMVLLLMITVSSAAMAPPSNAELLLNDLCYGIVTTIKGIKYDFWYDKVGSINLFCEIRITAINYIASYSKKAHHDRHGRINTKKSL